MSSLRDLVNAELEALRKANGGVLLRQHVVEAARKKGSALYEDFQRMGLWNDKHAAEYARLEYAGRVIRFHIKPPVDDHSAPIRTFVSLNQDRRNGGGYRDLDEVLDDPELTENLLQTALMELRAFRRRYDTLVALAGVISEIDKVEQDHPARSRRSAEAHATA